MSSKFIPINLPIIGSDEVKAVKAVLESNTLTEKRNMGPETLKFEEAFANYIGVKHAIAVNSGSAALHACLLALDLKKDQEVIVPTFSFVASASMVIHAGARVKFADVNPMTFNLDVDNVKKVISDKTRAIMPVHLYGHPVNMDPILELAEKKDIAVIEDACQAHGAEYKGKKVGSLGNAGCFSFYPSKNMTTGEGGMITTNDGELADVIRQIRNHGESENYLTTRLGHNFRMSEIIAAIGTVQLKRLDDFIKVRTQNADYLTKIINEIEKRPYNPPIVEAHVKHSWYLYTVKFEEVEKRDPFIVYMQKNNIGTGVYYSTPLHLMPLYRELYDLGPGSFPVSEYATRQVLSIPINPSISKSQMEFIGETIKNFPIEKV
ncbi:MAG: DegT/DnrJ/EryC1/StrS family aminotransferase [Candidatus Helarchaeota archaeon]